MSLRQQAVTSVVAAGMITIAAAWAARGQTGTETFTATASVKTAAGATATAPVTITIDRTTPQDEAARLVTAFDAGGAAGLREAMAAVSPTGSVSLGGGPTTPTRLTIERLTDEGRLLTIVTDTPLLFVGAGLPNAAPTAGYDFAIIDLTIDARGGGWGMLIPAASITSKQGVFIAQDYGAELVRLTSVSKTR